MFRLSNTILSTQFSFFSTILEKYHLYYLQKKDIDDSIDLIYLITLANKKRVALFFFGVFHNQKCVVGNMIINFLKHQV